MADRLDNTTRRALMRRPATTESGFGLVEAIVALAIVSLALTTLYRALSSAVHTAARVQVHDAALVLARTHLDSLGSDGTMQVGSVTGTYVNGLPWRLEVSALSTGSSSGREAAYRPFWVILEVFDRSGITLLKLETAKLARGAQ
jgi:type II secretory pathway pseudopilin PulG